MSALLKKLKIGLRVHLPNRNLQIFRFLLGAFIAYDLTAHFSDIQLLYTDQGIFSSTAGMASVSHAWWSIYTPAHSLIAVGLLYGIHLVLALLFMAGLGLPWVTAILWVFQFSLRNRNITIMDGSDDLSVVLLFFSFFLPLTPKLQDVKSRFHRFLYQPIWQAAFVIQMLCLYSFSAMQKSDVSWNSNFTAVSLALRLDILVNELGQWLLEFPLFLKASTAFVYSLELTGPMIYFVMLFFQNRFAIRTRQVICLLFILFHLGLSATMRLGVFPYYCIAAWILLFPTFNSNDEESAEPGSKFKILPTQIPSAVLSAVSILAVVFMNLRAIKSTVKAPEAIDWYASHFSLYQNWGMFAPFPALDNYHVKTYGDFSDGTRRELVDESFWLENRHRVKYWLNMDLKRRDFLMRYGEYWCRLKGNPASRESHVVSVNVVMFHRMADKEQINPDREFTHDLWIQPCQEFFKPQGSETPVRN